jgi:hypothetical protein
MGQKLPPDQMKLYRRIDEILTFVWDPIGIKEIPGARDEYQGYLPQVFTRVLGATEPAFIAEYLLFIESEQMGFTVFFKSRKRAFKIAELLIELRDHIIPPHPSP